MPEADAADSIVVEGKITSYEKARPGFGHHNAVMDFQISLYRLSDHSLITSFTPELKAFMTDKGMAEYGPKWLAEEINKALK